MTHISRNDAAADFDSFFAMAEAKPPGHFEKDCLWIVDRVQASAKCLPGIAALVLCSIQQPFYTMARQLAGVASQGLESPYLFGHKREGLAYVRENMTALHASAKRTFRKQQSLDDLIFDYLAIPSLGIVKASFLAQMTVGDGACLDTHNLRAIGLAESAFKTPKTLLPKSIRQRIQAYNAVWRASGDSAYWWDSWCDSVAARGQNSRGARIPLFFTDGAHVSASHRLAITAFEGKRA